jgi:hypothetical protein
MCICAQHKARPCNLSLMCLVLYNLFKRFFSTPTLTYEAESYIKQAELSHLLKAFLPNQTHPPSEYILIRQKKVERDTKTTEK